MGIQVATIDSREPAWTQALTFGGVPTLVMALEAGDVQVVTDDDKILVIERKTPEDFLSTLKADRLFPQCVKMLETSPWAYIVITGIFECSPLGKVITQPDSRITGWAWAALQGALLTVQEMGIGIVYVANDQEFEKTVIRLAARDRNVVHVPPARLPEVLGQGQALIASLPGVGIERCKAVLEYTGTPAWALTWLTELDSEEKVPGIGSITKAGVRRALGLSESDGQRLNGTATTDRSDLGNDPSGSPGDACGPMVWHIEPRARGSDYAQRLGIGAWPGGCL